MNKLAEGVLEAREQIDAGRRKRFETKAYPLEARQRTDRDRLGIRKAISRVLISNEVTRALAQEVEKELVIATGQKGNRS